MARKYSRQLEEKIVSCYKNGMSPYVMTETIPELNGKRPSVIYGVLKRLGVKPNKEYPRTTEQKESLRKYFLNDDFFHVIDTEEKAYWLGFMYADGYITSLYNRIAITIARSDKDHLEKFKKAVSFTGNICDYKATGFDNNETDCSRLIMSSDKMKSDLIKCGCVENKTFIIKFPSNDIVPDNLIWHFIRGYFDGDGSITHSHMQKNGVWAETLKFCGTKEMLYGIQQIFGTSATLEKRHDDNKNNYGITIGGNLQVKRILNNMYANATVYLDRKYNRYKQCASSMANATEDHG